MNEQCPLLDAIIFRHTFQNDVEYILFRLPFENNNIYRESTKKSTWTVFFIIMRRFSSVVQIKLTQSQKKHNII